MKTQEETLLSWAYAFGPYVFAVFRRQKQLKCVLLLLSEMQL